MLTATQARTAFGSIFVLENEEQLFRNQSERQQVKLEVRIGISSSIQHLILSIKYPIATEVSMGERALQEFWRCTEINESNRNDILNEATFVRTVDGVMIERLHLDDGWLSIKATPSNNQ